MRKIVSTLFSKQIILDKGNLYSIIIENKLEFYKFVNEIIEQYISKSNSVLTLSEDFKIIDFDRKTDLITDFLSITLDERQNINSLLKYVDKEIQSSALISEMHDINRSLICFINKSRELFDFDIDYDIELKLSSLYKMLNVTPMTNNDIPLERVITYFKFQNVFFGKDVFIILNLKSFFDKQSLSQLNEESKKLNVNVINLSSTYCKNEVIENEISIVLDEDLCEIV